MADHELAEGDASLLRALSVELKRGTGTADLRAFWRRYERFWPAVINASRRVPVYGHVIAELLELFARTMSAPRDA